MSPYLDLKKYMNTPTIEVNIDYS